MRNLAEKIPESCDDELFCYVINLYETVIDYFDIGTFPREKFESIIDERIKKCLKKYEYERFNTKHLKITQK